MVSVPGLVLLAVALLLAGPIRSVAAASPVEVRLLDTVARTESELRTVWQEYEPVYSGTPYVVAPSVNSPYSTGTVRPEFLADGLRTLNFARYLAGLPCDVTLDAGRTTEAQHGAVLLAASDFSHFPRKPDDMPQAFYDAGLASTSSSNIGFGYRDVESFQMGCLADSDSTNIVSVGHRRWLLNPQMKVTGIGYAERRHTTYAFDRSRSEKVEFTSVSWPSAGVFPVEFFGSRTPWSITLNPEYFDFDTSGHTVTLRRVADGQTWTFDETHKNTAGHYFNADFRGFGIRNAFIFRPEPATVSYEQGDEFEVALSGGIYLKGTRTPVTVSYWTQFVSLDSSAEPTPPATNYEQDAPGLKRISDRTRFSTAVEIAREGFPGWEGVTDVVIASGDDRAAADPLAASGLCWAYDAPMLLVSAARTPDEVKAAVKQIVDANGPITLRVVGGPVSVPDARIDEIKAHVGSANVSVDRIRETGGRYDLAASIAMRMRSVADADPDKEMPSVALLANGADATKFFDALALSPISAGTGAPILLVSHDSVPGATASALNTLKPTTRIVGGGPMTVSDAVLTQLGATRWSGRTRYDTAIAIVEGAVSRGWLYRETVGVAAVLPDALTGGAFVGLREGVLVITDGSSLTPTTCDWLISHKAQVREPYVFGGPKSICEIVRIQVDHSLR